MTRIYSFQLSSEQSVSDLGIEVINTIPIQADILSWASFLPKVTSGKKFVNREEYLEECQKLGIHDVEVELRMGHAIERRKPSDPLVYLVESRVVGRKLDEVFPFPTGLLGQVKILNREDSHGLPIEALRETRIAEKIVEMGYLLDHLDIRLGGLGVELGTNVPSYIRTSTLSRSSRDSQMHENYAEMGVQLPTKKLMKLDPRYGKMRLQRVEELREWFEGLRAKYQK